jgi:hypothetical protein
MINEPIRSNASRFSARRTFREYVSRYYPQLMIGADTAYMCALKK